VELRSDDGSQFTGLIIVDRNRPVLMLAARQISILRQPNTPSPYNPRPAAIQPRLFEEDDDNVPLWKRDESYWHR